MIEVHDCNVWYKKKKRRFKGKRVITFFIVCLIIVGLVIYYKNCITEQVLRICGDYSEVCATESINKAVLTTLKDQVKYSDLINVEKNSNGDVTYMSANSYKINSISRSISEKALKNLKSTLELGAPVPILSFTGIGIISGYGKTINYKAVYVSNVVCSFKSKFISMGINQTLHSIYIDVSADIKLEMPLQKKEKTNVSSVLVSEAIIVGKVPEIYLNGKLFE